MSEIETNLKPNFRHYHPKKFPAISKPKLNGYFSLNKERQYIPDFSNLKYLNLPPMGKQFKFNLNEDFEIYQQLPESAKNEKIDHLLRYIKENLEKLKSKNVENNNKKKYLNYDIVCFRGLLRLLMCTPYEFKENWCILATKYKGTIYLCIKETEKKAFERLNESEKSKKFCYYGFKFEKFILTSQPNTVPDTSALIVEGAEEFCTMFECTLERNSLLYGAEMDGVASDIQLNLDDVNDWSKIEFIEVKVKRREDKESQLMNFYKWKLKNWWCQSFLVGIKTLYYGLRNDNGIVEEINSMSVNEMPKLAKKFWSPAVCLAFCVDFINLVNREMKNVDSANTVFKFSYDPETDKMVKYEIYLGKTENSFLPDWYTECLH